MEEILTQRYEEKNRPLLGEESGLKIKYYQLEWLLFWDLPVPF